MGDDVQCMHVYNYVHRYIRREQHYARNVFMVLEDAWTWRKFKVVSLILEASEAREVIVHLAMRKERIRTQHTHIRITFRFRQRSMPRQVVDRILPFQFVISEPELLNNLFPSTVHDLVSISN